ncbi:MAG: helix-turn-helix transcriptional regulator [Pseudomonadota bacterium]
MPVPSFAGAGPALRNARERMGLSLDDIAGETRIAVRHLIAIEESRFDGFAAPVYALGFAHSYARSVGIPRQWISDCLREQIHHVFEGRARFDLGWVADKPRKRRGRRG